MPAFVSGKEKATHVVRRKGVEWQLLGLARSNLEWEGEFYGEQTSPLNYTFYIVFAPKWPQWNFKHLNNFTDSESFVFLWTSFVTWYKFLCCMFSSGLFSGVWILYVDVSEHTVYSIFIGR
jgi:hypothetical protein